MASVIVVGLSSSSLLLLLLLLLSSFNHFVVADDDDWNLKEDVEGWVDPHSMIHDHDLGFQKKKDERIKSNDESCSGMKADCAGIERKVAECNRKVEKLEKNLDEQKELYQRAETIAVKEQPFFKQYLQQVLSLFINYKTNTRIGHYVADIALSSNSYGHVFDYVTYQNVSVQEVHYVLSSMMTNVQWLKDESDIYEDLGTAFFLSPDIIHCLHVIALGLVIMVAAFHAVSMIGRINISLGRFLFLLLFFLTVASFVISIPWTWWHLYKKKVAERMARVARGGQDDCRSQVTNLWRTIASIFVVQTDQCQKYIEDMEIDPLWEVPPTQALAVTMTRFFLEPAGYIGRAIREFMMSAFEGLPISLWLPVFVFIVLLLVLTLFCFGRYRVYTPFLRIEPMQHDDSALRAQILHLQSRNEELEQGNRMAALVGGGDQRHNPQIVPAIQDVPVDFPDVASAKEKSSEKKNVILEVKRKELTSNPEEKSGPSPKKNDTDEIRSEMKTSDDSEEVDKCKVAKNVVQLPVATKSQDDWEKID